MSAKETKELLRQMTPEQTQLLSTKQLSASKTIAEWLEFFRSLSVVDKHSERIVSQSGKLSLGLFMFAFLSIFIIIFFRPFIFLSIPALIVAIIVYLRGRRFKRYTIRNQMREVLVPFVAIMRNEIKSKHPLKLSFDFRDLNDPQYKTKFIKNTRRRLPKVDTTFYQMVRIETKFRLRDGSSFNWSIKEILRERKITKRGQTSGKIKTKRKYKTKHVLEVKASFPKELFVLNPEGSQNVLRSDSPTHHIIRVKSKGTTRNLDTYPKLQFILNGMAKAYQQVTLNP